jgi:two-component system cell cycle response regulator DivK
MMVRASKLMVKQILVVEDNPMNAQLLSDILESLSLGIIRAKNGMLGLEAARNDAPDLILLDVLLPDMNGIEVLKQLKADDVLKHIPVIALTASANSDIYRQCIEAGCDAFMTKPFTKRQLTEQLEKFLPDMNN